MNSLVGVLIRFRKENIAVMCDIEQMFRTFHVNVEHQNFFRFFWFEDNDLSKETVEYRMTVHLFGNASSPAIATFGLRHTADDGEEKYGKETSQFVHRNFYVDDGLSLRPTATGAVNLDRNAQAMLATANIRLHKVVSNEVAVMEAFPAEDRTKSISDLDLAVVYCRPNVPLASTGTSRRIASSSVSRYRRSLLRGEECSLS